MTPTRRVRILVVIDSTGQWEAGGSASWNDAEARQMLDELPGDLGAPPWGYHWVEADVPVPAIAPDVAIEGDVAAAEYGAVPGDVFDEGDEAC